jgi:bifunctional oligoribonuclease and PAP phosphatase NrnA
MVKTKIASLNDVISSADNILVIQAENPDGDSLGSALALEEILGNLGKKVSMYCAVDVPKYLRYMPGWDRVSNEMPKNFDTIILVDASALNLLEKTYKLHANKLQHKAFVIIDHHENKLDITETTHYISDPKAVSAGEMIYVIADELSWDISTNASYFIASSMISDSGNFVYEKTSAKTFRIMADLLKKGLDLQALHRDRRASDIKPVEIVRYKGKLLERIQYLAKNTIAIVTIPWEEIEQYSDIYNPSELVMGDMLSTKDVKLAVSFKQYSDGTITGKIRSNLPIASTVATKFGGGGHKFAAGCKVRDKELKELINEFVDEVTFHIKQIEENDKAI